MSIKVEDWSGSAATDRLQKTIERFEQENTKHTRTMIKLTWAMTGLTVMMAIGLVVQIWLTFYPPHP